MVTAVVEDILNNKIIKMSIKTKKQYRCINYFV